jgi:hypothetical protein
MELTKKWIEAGLDDLKINAMCGYFNLDREMMQAMKDAGYYMIRVGIETASEKVAEQIGLKAKFNLDRLKDVLREGKDLGIKMYGTFLIGAPGSTRKEDEKTITLLKELVEEELLWNFQISICTPQPGTPFFKWASANGYLKKDVDWYRFDGGNCAVVDYPDYRAEEIEEVFNKAEGMYEYSKILNLKKNKEKILQQLNRLDASKCIVAKCVRSELYNEIINVLGGNYALFVQESSVGCYKNLNRNTISFPDGFIDEAVIDNKVKDRLSREFEYGIVPVNNPDGRGYENVINFFKNRGLAVYLLTMDGSVIKI